MQPSLSLFRIAESFKERDHSTLMKFDPHRHQQNYFQLLYTYCNNINASLR
jgi:hypothetical protein